jgi:hypothetical protein
MSRESSDVERVAQVSAIALHKELSAAIHTAITSGDDNTSRVARNIAHDMVRRITPIHADMARFRSALEEVYELLEPGRADMSNPAVIRNKIGFVIRAALTQEPPR